MKENIFVVLSLSLSSRGCMALHYHFSAEYIVPIFTQLSTERWVCQDQTWDMINREKVGSLSLPSSVMTIVIIIIHLTVTQSQTVSRKEFDKNKLADWFGRSSSDSSRV